jgi:hypothetical protein
MKVFISVLLLTGLLYSSVSDNISLLACTALLIVSLFAIIGAAAIIKSK